MEKKAYMCGTTAVARPSVCVQVFLLLQGSIAEGLIMQCSALGYVRQMQ